MATVHTDFHYDPAKSHVTDEALQEFIQHPDIMDLTKVPGIGPATAKALSESKVKDMFHVNTGYALIGCYMALVEPSMTQQRHCDLFVEFLHHHGVKGNLHTICSAIANRAAIAFPAIYDKHMWDNVRSSKGKASASPALSGA
jgi:hypothetical protein